MPFFSIIVPVYNVEAYLDECLNSIVCQTFTDFEVIIVNDGSTDKSLSICEFFASKYPCVKLINQSNKGLSGARNTGFGLALGQYIWFVDSDDYLQKNSLMILYNTLINTNVDVLGFSNYHFIEKTQILKENNINPETAILTNLELINQNLLFEIAPWIYTYKHTFLKNNNISFREDIKIHEDEFYLIEILSKLKTIKFISDRLYIYRIRPNSLMRSHRIGDKLYSFSQLIYFSLTLKNNYLNRTYWDNRLMNNFQHFYKLYFNLNDEHLRKQFGKDYKKIRKINLKISKTDYTGIKLLKLLHNHCFPLYKLKLLK